MAQIVAMYNNKGGVSKTTTLFNLAVFLSRGGKRVLVVDCDPQCNVTEMFFASTDLLDDPDRDLPGTSIYQALHPRFAGDTRSIDAASIQLVDSGIYPNLSILRGDLEFTMAENYFGNAWNQAITENINEKNTYVVFYRMLHTLAAVKQFDYVLCDVGPSTGAITRTVVLACDGFIVPLTPDRFCYQAVRVLGSVIRQWIERHDQITRTFTPFGIDSFPGRPLMLGAVIQNFKVHSGRVKESYVKWQNMIAEKIASDLLGPGGVDAGPHCDPKHPFVATIRDVGPLAPVAQMFGRAIFDIRQEDTKVASTTGQMYYGTVWQPWLEKMGEYQSEIEKIAKVLP
ncbi:MAG: ParA family protein [Phycisphaerae bacterium]|nr:ParA family protein [Phycisphaerae bacterium]